MKKQTNVPAFLDQYSDLKEEQVDTINTIVRTQYNRFLEKIEQTQLPDDEIKEVVSQPSWRVTNLRDLNYANTTTISFDFDTSGMVAGTQYKIMEVKPCKFLSEVVQQSGLSDLSSTASIINKDAKALGFYGVFYIDVLPSVNEYFIAFKATRGEKDTSNLPNTNWKCSITFYQEL